MTNCKRNGKRWSTPEILQLHREYELLGMTPDEIALKHNRTLNSIVYKLESEGLTNFNQVNKNIVEKNVEEKNMDDDDYDSSSDYVYNDDDQDEDFDYIYDECNVDNLTNRVWNLETSVHDISTMVREIFNNISNKKKSKKLAPLRKTAV